jgi:tetratricopeptide (TPR) repeat protein
MMTSIQQYFYKLRTQSKDDLLNPPETESKSESVDAVNNSSTARLETDFYAQDPATDGLQLQPQHATPHSERLPFLEAEPPAPLILAPNLESDRLQSTMALTPIETDSLSAVAPVEPTSDALEMQAWELLHQGDRYLMQDQLEAAIAHYRRAVQFAPDLVDAHQGLAEALSQQGNLAEATVHYQKALELTPLPTPEAIAAASQTQPKPQLPATTEPENRDALEQLPWYEKVAFHLQQGKVLCSQENWKAAIESFQQAIQLMEPHSATAYRLLGKALQAEQRLQEAEHSYRKSLALQPEMAETHARMASVYAEQNRLKDAVRFYEQAIAREPKFAGAYLKLSEVWQQLNDEVRSTEYLYQAAQLEPDWITHKEHIRLGKSLVQQGKLEQGMWCYRQAIELQEKDAEAYGCLADTWMLQDKWQEAVQDYRRAIQRDAAAPHYFDGLGQALMKLERWQEAIACYQRMTGLKLDYVQHQAALNQMERCQQTLVAESYFRMAMDLQRQQNWQEAVNCYRQAIARNGDRGKYHACLGQVLMKLGEWQEGVSCYEAALRSEPQNLQYHKGLADGLMRLGRFEEAAQFYRRLVDPIASHSETEQTTESPSEASFPPAEPNGLPFQIF